MSENHSLADGVRTTRLLLDAIGQAVIATDLLGTVTVWNAAAETLYGWSAEEAIGRPIGQLTVPETGQEQTDAILAALAAGQPWTGERTVQRRDGTRFPAIVSDSGIYNDNGDLCGIIGVSTDLTEIRRAEQAHLVSERRLQIVVENSPLMLVAFDVDGTILLAEGRDLHRLGPPALPLVGKPLAELTRESPATACAVRRCLAGESSDEQLSFLGRHFEFHFRPTVDTAGRVTGVVAVGSDITESVIAAHASGRREQRWEALIAQSADVAVIADPSTTNLTYVSPAVTRLFGWDPKMLIGRPGLSLVHPEDLETLTQALGRVGEDAAAHATVEFRLECADGSYRWVEETISNLSAVPGVRGLVGNVRDVNDRRAAEQALHRRDRVTRALAAKAADVALVVGADGRVIYGNPSASTVLVAAEGDTLVGMDYVHPDDRKSVMDAFRGLAAPDATARMTFRRLGVDGTWRWVEQIVTNCLTDSAIGGLVVNIREITDKVQAEAALRESEMRYRLIAETAQEGIWATDPDGRTSFANQKMADLLGRSLADLYSNPTWELITGTTRAGFEQRLRRRHQHGTDRYDVRHTRPDGSARTLRICASPFAVEGSRVGSLAMVSDITDARRVEVALHYRAHHDMLTGLANRALLVERLQAALNREAETRQGSIVVLVADLDQFKLVNDSFGHAAGDDLLVEVARRWGRVLQPNDVFSRLGGDEFVIMRADLGSQNAYSLADELSTVLEEPIVLDGRPVTVTASIGIAVTTGTEDADTLLRHADTAMYEAKSQGRGRTAVFTACLAEKARRRLDMFVDLKSALVQDELELHYQPVVEISSGRLLGVEALCRWNHPQRGAVSPDEFITLAEETGLIQPLDRWVLRRACRDGAAMRASGVLPADVYLAVNVSAGHVAQPGFESAVLSALAEFGLPANALVLEVTESAVMRDPEAAQAVLENLHELGVRIAIDDFGTGYSSLAYLRRLPVGALKIDRSFIHHISDSEDDRSIVTAVISLAAALDVTTTAEGIETFADLALLQHLGCPAGQGFYWSPAISPSDLEALLARLPNGRFCVQTTARRSLPVMLPPARNPSDGLEVGS